MGVNLQAQIYKFLGHCKFTNGSAKKRGDRRPAARWGLTPVDGRPGQGSRPWRHFWLVRGWPDRQRRTPAQCGQCRVERWLKWNGRESNPHVEGSLVLPVAPTPSRCNVSEGWWCPTLARCYWPRGGWGGSTPDCPVPWSAAGRVTVGMTVRVQRASAADQWIGRRLLRGGLAC